MDALDNARPFDFEHFGHEGFAAFRCIPAQVAFADFRPHQLSRPGHAKALDSGFMGFEFYFSGWLFPWHNTHSFYTKVRGSAGIRGHFLSIVRGKTQTELLLLLPFIWRKDHEHGSSFNRRCMFDHGDIGQFFRNLT